ncbi:MAG: DUF4832 domain-containing protein [Chthonomonadales bacterium]|nr:DUF4832 domain-containing protein [Chthonomonadales bacterium]
MHGLASSAALAALLAATGALGQPAVTATPREIDAVMPNPHMGWETFHRPADTDRALPPWIPSTVTYLRWGWGTVEPTPGAIDTAMLDGALAAARKAGQRLAFRIMCCSSEPSEPYQPAWLARVGGRIARTTYDGVALEVPDLDDPVTLERHLSLIRRLGARYDGSPDLDHVDLGSVGWWGEWHMSGGGPVPMPRKETCRRIVDAYLSAFRRTPLLMLIGGGEQTAYACARGAGWRADCLGDMGGFSANWCHMRQGYPQWFREASLREAWRRAPVAYESCWDMRKWVQEKWPLRYIFNYALATHASYFNNKSAPLPDGPDVRKEIERFLRRLGYRLVLRQVCHPAAVAAGTTVEVASRWQNVGSAPCYRPYRVAWRLRRAGATRAQALGRAVSGWMPGEVALFTPEFLESPPDLPPGPIVAERDRLTLRADLDPGEYALEVAVVDPATRAPAVRLAIEGRATDGWYPVSHLRVTRRRAGR